MALPQILQDGEGTQVSLPKAVLTIKNAAPGHNSAEYIFAELRVEPGFAGPGLHSHDHHEELFFILSGEFDWLVDGKTQRLGAGSFIKIPPGVLHDFCNPKDEPASILVYGAPEEIGCYSV